MLRRVFQIGVNKYRLVSTDLQQVESQAINQLIRFACVLWVQLVDQDKNRFQYEYRLLQSVFQVWRTNAAFACRMRMVGEKVPRPIRWQLHHHRIHCEGGSHE